MMSDTMNHSRSRNPRRDILQETIVLEQRLMIGRGRDGLIFRIGSSNMPKSGHKGQAVGGCWGGWVLKVPRFCLEDLPQLYVKAVAQHIQSNSAEFHARNSMVANFNFEGDLQGNLWTHLCQTYLPTIGFPSLGYGKFTWYPDPHDCAQKVHVKAELEEDNTTRSIDALIMRAQCHMMPEGVMDAFQALIHHFTENLLLNFCRDILHQLLYLEKMGVAHGDFKLSNVLMFVWNDKHYVFVLADFWDAFTVEPDEGAVLEMRSNEEMLQDGRRLDLMGQATSEFRRLLRWKFTTEKFGTRLYKDPHILCELRKCRRAKRRFKTIRGLKAGAINLWSFGVVIGSLLAPNKDSDRIKTVIKDEILFSGRGKPDQLQLTEREAVHEFRKLYEGLLRPHKQEPKPSSNKPVHPNRLIGRNEFIDSLKQVIMEKCMLEHDYRASTQEVIDFLQLDRKGPPASERDVAKDLHNCGRCTMCVWMNKQQRITAAQH